MGHVGFDQLEHARWVDLQAVRRDYVLLLRLHLEEMAERGLKADVVEGGHFVTRGRPSSVQNRPLRQLGDRVLPLFVPLILLDPEFACAFEEQEGAFRGLEANGAAESYRVFGVAVFKLE